MLWTTATRNAAALIVTARFVLAKIAIAVPPANVVNNAGGSDQFGSILKTATR